MRREVRCPDGNETIRDGKDVIRPSNRRGLDIAAKAAICVQTVAVSWRPAIRRVSRSWLRPSSICEPSDPPPGVVCGVCRRMMKSIAFFLLFDKTVHEIRFKKPLSFGAHRRTDPPARSPNGTASGAHLPSGGLAPDGGGGSSPLGRSPKERGCVCVPKQQHRQ